MGDGQLIRIYTTGEYENGESIYPYINSLSELLQSLEENRSPVDLILKVTSEEDSNGNLIVKPAEDNYESNKKNQTNNGN